MIIIAAIFIIGILITVFDVAISAMKPPNPLLKRRAGLYREIESSSRLMPHSHPGHKWDMPGSDCSYLPPFSIDIYALIDDMGVVFYVGQSNDMFKRHAQHMKDAVENGSHKQHRIWQMKQDGKAPGIKRLDTCRTRSEADAMEKVYIRRYPHLVNTIHNQAANSASNTQWKVAHHQGYKNN